MAGLFNILKVTVSEDKICAHVLVNPGMPLMTSEDIEATARVYYLVPAIAKHLCLGDSGRFHLIMRKVLYTQIIRTAWARPSSATCWST